MTIIDEILGGIIVALLVAFGVVLILNANLRADLAVARANTQTLNSANANLKADAEKQNQAIAALKTAGDAHALAAAKAIKAAAVQAKRYAAQAAMLSDPTTGDDCAAAVQILRDYLSHR